MVKNVRVLVLPTGITVETVKGLVSNIQVDAVVSVYLDDGMYMDKKQEVLNTLKIVAELTGLKYYVIPVKPFSNDVAKVFDVLKKLRARIVYLSGLTGTRYLLLSLIPVIRSYCREASADFYLVIGVEGNGWHTEPAEGFFRIASDLTPAELNVFKVICYTRKVRIKELMNSIGYGRGIYRILRNLEEKGLIKRERGSVELSHPGSIICKIIGGDINEA